MNNERFNRMEKKRSERLIGSSRLEEFVLKVVDAEVVIDEVIGERDRARLALLWISEHIEHRDGLRGRLDLVTADERNILRLALQ